MRKQSIDGDHGGPISGYLYAESRFSTEGAIASGSEALRQRAAHLATSDRLVSFGCGRSPCSSKMIATSSYCPAMRRCNSPPGSVFAGRCGRRPVSKTCSIAYSHRHPDATAPTIGAPLLWRAGLRWDRTYTVTTGGRAASMRAASARTPGGSFRSPPSDSRGSSTVNPADRCNFEQYTTGLAEIDPFEVVPIHDGRDVIIQAHERASPPELLHSIRSAPGDMMHRARSYEAPSRIGTAQDVDDLRSAPVLESAKRKRLCSCPTNRKPMVSVSRRAVRS